MSWVEKNRKINNRGVGGGLGGWGVWDDYSGLESSQKKKGFCVPTSTLIQ